MTEGAAKWPATPLPPLMASPHKKLIRHNFNAIYPCCRGSVNETGAGYRRFEATGAGAYQRKFPRSIRALGANCDLTRRSIMYFLGNCVKIDTYMAAQLATRSCHCTVQLHRSRIAGGPYEGQAGVRGHQWRLGLQRPREWASARCFYSSGGMKVVIRSRSLEQSPA